ncbi:MAG TPA: cyclodeaminase/cyclohydrolase family protein [Patescibacteria group bacterium]|nr:cyclodeaminase/cyclohydrolase family protein [Patescibacteria group bacterium]
MLIDLSIKDFANAVAAHEPVLPAGGCVIAVSGLLGVSLLEMAVNSACSQSDREAPSGLTRIKEHLTALHTDLSHYIEQDAVAYSGLLAAYKLPKTTSEEADYRRDKILTAALRSIEIPLKIATACLAAMEPGISFLPQTKPGVSGDLKIGLLTLRTCVDGSLAAARINLPLIRNNPQKAAFKTRIDQLQQQFDEIILKLR